MANTHQLVTILQETVARAKSFSVLTTKLLTVLAGLENLAIKEKGRRNIFLVTDS